MILEPKNDPSKQAHQAGFMVIDMDVDAIVQEWPEEWQGPLVEPMVEGKNQEDPPANQGGNVGVGPDAKNI